MRPTTKILLLALLAIPVLAFEPIERFNLSQERPSNLEEPCSESWERLHWWYSDVDMSCALFREQILGCTDRWRLRWTTTTYRAQCILLVAFGADSPKRFSYQLFGRKLGRSTYLKNCPDEKDWERGLDLLRTLNGIPRQRKRVFGMNAFEYDLPRMKKRFSPENGTCTPRTQANRDAAEWAARRTRYDP